MTDIMSYGVLAGICGLVLLIGVLKSRAEFVLNFLVRMVLGAICIVFLNDFFETQGIDLTVGLNLDKVKTGCYNPCYKQTKEVMCWESDDTDIAASPGGGSSGRFPEDEDQ